MEAIEFFDGERSSLALRVITAAAMEAIEFFDGESGGAGAPTTDWLLPQWRPSSSSMARRWVGPGTAGTPSEPQWRPSSSSMAS